MTQQTFKCKHPECEEEVVYKPDIITGVGLSGRRESDKISVSLVCPNGHRYSYQVDRE